jgi:hypothetical protein
MGHHAKFKKKNGIHQTFAKKLDLMGIYRVILYYPVVLSLIRHQTLEEKRYSISPKPLPVQIFLICACP